MLSNPWPPMNRSSPCLAGLLALILLAGNSVTLLGQDSKLQIPETDDGLPVPDLFAVPIGLRSFGMNGGLPGPIVDYRTKAPSCFWEIRSRKVGATTWVAPFRG